MAETRPNPRRAHSKGSDRKGGENNGDEPHEATKKRPESTTKATEAEEAPRDTDQSGTQRGGEKKVTLAMSSAERREREHVRSTGRTTTGPDLCYRKADILLREEHNSEGRG
jgi:hypothetical protein